jgi:hypothetical protein
MSELQAVVRAVRKVKADARVSFKGIPLVAEVEAHSGFTSLPFSSESQALAKGLLRLFSLAVNRERTETEAQDFDWWAGSGEVGGVKVRLWAQSNPWQQKEAF